MIVRFMRLASRIDRSENRVLIGCAGDEMQNDRTPKHCCSLARYGAVISILFFSLLFFLLRQLAVDDVDITMCRHLCHTVEY